MKNRQIQSIVTLYLAGLLWLPQVNAESAVNANSVAEADSVAKADSVAIAESAQVKAQNALAAAPAVDASGGFVSAHDVVRSKTTELIALIEDAQGYVDEDEERFFRELEALLDPFIDFRSFARAVMGRHASSQRMQSLPEDGQQQLVGQIDRFSDIFAQGLIQTYGKGLLAFEGERIEVVAPENVDPQASRVPVKQLIYGDRQKPFQIIYSLRRNAEGEWKLRNVIIESINLGKVYRNQFANAAKVYNGDLDRVIDQWNVVPATGTEETR